MFIIRLTTNPWFITGYNNTYAEPSRTLDRKKAKGFATEQEAEKWAKAYLCAYNWEVQNANR